MFSIIGILIVFGAVIGGFLMEKGNLLVLVQPAELVTIGVLRSVPCWPPTPCIF